jgi:hypothetical protein
MARSDAKLKNLPRETLDELWDLKSPDDPEQKALGLVEICGVLRDQYKIEIGKSALAEFYQWLDVQRRMWARERLCDQIKEEIAKDPSLTPEQVRKAGQRLFMADGILERDVVKFKVADDSMGAEYRARQKDAEIAIRKKNTGLLERKVKLLEKKAAQADAAEKVSGDGSLTAEEKAARLKQIFGMG